MYEGPFTKRDYLTQIYVKDAYLAILVHHNFHKFLCFSGKTRTLNSPACHSAAPLVFRKIMRTVITCLLDRSIRCVIYLDNLLLMNRNQEILKEQTLITLDILETLRFW